MPDSMTLDEAKNMVKAWLEDKTAEDKVVLALFICETENSEDFLNEVLYQKAVELWPHEFEEEPNA